MYCRLRGRDVWTACAFPALGIIPVPAVFRATQPLDTAMIDLGFVIPGDITLRTGGYIYDRRVLGLLSQHGVNAHHVPLPGTFPYPHAADLDETVRTLAALPASMPLLIDGLAYGAMPEAVVSGIAQPIIALVHHPLYLETGLDAAAQQRFRMLEQKALTFATHVITTSGTTARGVAADFDYPPQRITVAEPGTDRGRRAIPRTGGDADALRLLAVGSIVPRKAYPVLISALEPLRDLAWHLTIAGDDARSPAATRSLKAQIAASPNAGRIALQGALDDGTLHELYAASDVFVMSSLYEGYGMVLGEALAHGLPIVATRAGAAAETLPDAAALKVEPGDSNGLSAALRQVLEDAGLRRRLAEQSWAAGQRLPTWNDTARRIADVVKTIARERP